MKKQGILLVNLGTPDSPKPRDVYRYLIEFLTDGRVIDSSWLSRQLLVRGIIVPSRYRQSASSYQKIWTPEGSPLKIYGRRLRDKLQQRLGGSVQVELAMRYQHPSIPEVLEGMKGVEKLTVLPLFPQFASATTGSVYQKVMECISQWEIIPEIVLKGDYATHPKLIEAFCAVAAPYDCRSYDQILFSFHGLPQRQIYKADRKGRCLTEGCCKQNRNCYASQCYATAHALINALQLPEGSFSISFQSRLGKDPWLQPYTSEEITKFAREGKKRLLVFCPSFVSDCLETLYEIGIEYGAEFRHAGGETLDLVPGLNDHPQWIEALESILS